MRKGGWLVMVAALAAGCASSEFEERPVSRLAPPLQAGVYTVQRVDVKPVATHEVEPDYPPEMGVVLTGKATVVFTVAPNGKVVDPLVVQADDVLFGEAAVAAVSKWRFHPAEVKGAPVACRMSLPFMFDSPYGYGVNEVGGALPAGDKPPGEAGDDSITAHASH